MLLITDPTLQLHQWHFKCIELCIYLVINDKNPQNVRYLNKKKQDIHFPHSKYLGTGKYKFLHLYISFLREPLIIFFLFLFSLFFFFLVEASFSGNKRILICLYTFPQGLLPAASLRKSFLLAETGAREEMGALPSHRWCITGILFQEVRTGGSCLESPLY